MKAIRLYLFIAGLILVLLCTFIPSWRDWCVAWTFNAIYLIDNVFYITGVINPILLWAIVFLFLGACAGLIRAVNRYKLDKKIKYAGFLGIFLILLLTVSISKPIEHGQSREFREEMLWNKINKEKSYHQCLNYFKEFPAGKYQSQVQVIQEQALWDSANALRSIVDAENVWKLYLEKFPTSYRFLKARAIHENSLWTEAKFFNSTNLYTDYINQYPNGKFIRKAYSALKKLQPKIIQEAPVKTIADTTIKEVESPQEVQGRIKYPDGRLYIGILVNGEPGGNGREFFTDKTYLEGTWKNGKRQGEFIFHKADGSTETQEFDNGSRIK